MLAATMAIWVSFLVVAAAVTALPLRAEPTATSPGGPFRPLVLVPTDLLTFSTLVERIRLAPLVRVLVLLLLLLLAMLLLWLLLLLLLLLPAASDWPGCRRFSLLTGVIEMEAVVVAAAKAVVGSCCGVDCCCDCGDCCVSVRVLTAGGLLLALLLVAVLLLLFWVVLLLAFQGHWCG